MIRIANRKVRTTPKLRASEIDERVLKLFDKQAKAAGIESLTRLLNGGVSRRTLQRRLSSLVAEGKLVTIGEGRAVRYRLPFSNLENEQRRESKESDVGEFELPLSTSGAQVQASVRRPLSACAFPRATDASFSMLIVHTKRLISHRR